MSSFPHPATSLYRPSTVLPSTRLKELVVVAVEHDLYLSQTQASRTHIHPLATHLPLASRLTNARHHRDPGMTACMKPPFTSGRPPLGPPRICRRVTSQSASVVEDT